MNPIWLRVLVPVLVLGLTALSGPLEAYANDEPGGRAGDRAGDGTVRVRGGEHEGFGRLVFDLDDPVPYIAEISQGELVIVFEQPARFDFVTLARDLAGYVAQPKVSDDRKTVTFPLKRRFGLKEFRLGPKLVVDLIDRDPSSILAIAPAAGPALAAAPQLAQAPPQAQAPPSASDPATGEAPKVRLRIGEHPGFSRLVFDWPAETSYQLSEEDGRAVIRFGSAGRLDLSRFDANPLPGVNAVTPRQEDGRLVVALTVAPGSGFKSYVSGRGIVVDVLAPKASSTPETPSDLKVPEPDKKPPQPALAEASENRPGPSPAAELAAPTSLLPPSMTATVKPAEARPGEAEAPKSSEAEAPKTAAPETRIAAAGDPPAPAQTAPVQIAPAQTAEVPAADEESGEKKSTTPPADPQSASDQPTNDQPPADQPAGEPPSIGQSKDDALASVQRAEPLMPVPGRRPSPDQPIALRFNWAEPTAAALFRRGPYLWLVFDRPAAQRMENKIAKVAPELAPIQRLESEVATILRLRARPVLNPRLIAAGNSWTLELRTQKEDPEDSLKLVVEAERQDPVVQVALEGPVRVETIVDPDVGDLIYVVPLRVPGLGLPLSRSFPQFRTLASVQGLVVQSLSDQVELSVAEPGIVIRAGEGLFLSKNESDEFFDDELPVPVSGPRLFDLEAWRRGSLRRFTENKNALQRAIMEAPAASANLARLDLARFYFAHGLATEALGMIGLIGAAAPRLVEDPQILLLKGVSEFLTEDYDGARTTLAHPALAGEPEARLWQAALAAVSQDWTYAADSFAGVEPLMAAYNRQISTRLHLLAAEAQIVVGDNEGANLLLTELREAEPNALASIQIDFLEGRRLLIDQEKDAAKELWRKVARGPHAPSRARARLALIKMGLKDGEISPAQAAAELERLRFAWRGDQFEFALLEQLGDLYEGLGAYRRALLSFRQAASYLSDSEGMSAVTERMRKIFSQVFFDQSEEALPPLKTLALYEEFRELTPAGKDGDVLIAGLADRLAAVDLLDQAAGLLDNQVRSRLEGIDKVRVGTRLALLRLMDRKPEAALAALDLSAGDDLPDGLPEDLTMQRRQMKARALAELGREDAALALLEGDDSADALRLRADLQFGMEDWTAAAATLLRLLPDGMADDMALDQNQSEALVALAVAYTLAQDRTALRDLEWRFGEAMRDTDGAATFAMLTGNLEVGAITSIADELAGVKTIQAFMASYRERIKEASLSGLN